jgi:hypothetical protein
LPSHAAPELELSFKLTCTQDPSGFAVPGGTNPVGRTEVGRDMSDAELHALLSFSPSRRATVYRDGGTGSSLGVDRPAAGE